MSTSHRSIPASIKRAVRQRTGFGCIFCGSPIVQYDHMTPWSVVQEHAVDNITTLCPNHHMDKTAGRLDEKAVQIRNRSPLNKSLGKTTPYPLYYGQKAVTVVVGSNVFETTTLQNTAVWVIDGEEIISVRFEDGVCLLSLQWLSDKGEVVLRIVDNELIFSASLWDVVFIGTTLTVRSALRGVCLQLTFDAPSTLILEKVSALLFGRLVTIDAMGTITVGTHFLTGCLVHNVAAGLVIGYDNIDRGAAFFFPDRADTQES